MKAIILAGGTGSRLYPLTKIASKQLQAVFDKPMIYYPITALIASGVKNFCLISTPQLGDGCQWGITIQYREQPYPGGIAQAFIIAEDFIGADNVILMLGDNIFSGGNDFPRAVANFSSGATIFAYHTKDPERYGVVEFDQQGRAISIEEKPSQPRSNYAVPGIYIYDNEVLTIARSLTPSARGELEITDVNLEYLKRGKLQVHRLSRGYAWLDAGTSTALHDAAMYIAAIERRQGVKIGCPEEAALVRKFITIDQFRVLLEHMPNCEYRDYLITVANEWCRQREELS